MIYHTRRNCAVLFAAVTAVISNQTSWATVQATYVGTAGSQSTYDANVATAASSGDLIYSGNSSVGSVALPSSAAGFGSTGLYDGSTAANANFTYLSTSSPNYFPATYVFNMSTGSAVGGYTLTSIQSVAGWANSNLAEQNYDVYVTTLANPAFTQIGGNFFNSYNVSNQASTAASSMTTINDSSGILASGVTGIKITLISTGFINQGGNGGTLYRDMAVMGSATPIFDANTSLAGAQDGSGNWDSTTQDFYIPTTGIDVAYANTSTSTAVFGNGGTAGVVTVGSVSANGIYFGTTTGNYNLTGGTISLGGTNPSITNVVDATIGSNINSSGGLLKNGNGNLTLTGTNNFGSAVTFINYGTLTVAGMGSVTSSNLIGIGGNAGNIATLNISTTGALTFTATGISAVSDVGCQAGGLGVVNQTNGAFNLSGNLALGYVSGTASGTYNLTGVGTLNIAGPNPGLVVGWGGTGVYYQAGNTNFNDGGYLYIAAQYATGLPGLGVATFAGGTANVGNNSGPYATNIAYGTNSVGVMNIGTEAGGNAVVTVVNGGINVGDGAGATGIINLNSGVLQIDNYYMQYNVAGITSIVNLNGGTLRVGSAAIPNLVNPAQSPTLKVYNGGLTVDSNSFNSAVLAPLITAAGNGVYEPGGIISTGGLSSGLTGSPLVTVTDSGSGTGLTAIADVSGGSVTGFTLTSPGEHYSVGDTLSFTITGAGATGTTTFTHVLTSGEIAANATGGLTKIGIGNLRLGGGNTYTGSTTINAGSLALGAVNSISGSSAITLSGASILNTGGFNQSLATLTTTGANTIDFGAGNAGSTVGFAASNTKTWSGTLTISDWTGNPVTGNGSDQLYFGSSSSGLTAAQLSEIKFTGFNAPAAILSNGEVVPAANSRIITTPVLSGTPSIMPLGDSITDGRSGSNGTLYYPGGYRGVLYNNLSSAGFAFSFVGSVNDNPTAQLTAANETLHNGYAGVRIDQLTSNIDSYLGGANRANAILLMIGTNDVTQMYDPAYSGSGSSFGPNFASDAAGRLATLISDIYTDAPGSTVYVSSIIPILTTSDYSGSRWNSTYEAQVVAYNQLIQTQVVPEFQASGDSIFFVNNFSAFQNSNGSTNVSLYGTSDDEHPGATGYAAMGQTWTNAILSPFTTLTITAGELETAPLHAASAAKNTLFFTSLSIAGTTGAWTGRLDLTNNDMVVRSGSLATVTNQVAQGYAHGTWQGGGGILSSAAAADSTHLTALGVIQNSIDGTTSGTALYATFDGQAVNNADVLVKYTYYGDANLDGTVNASDYTRIDNGFINQLTGWFNGDFNYDGVVDGSDYALIDNSFNTQGATIAAATASSTAEIAGLGNTAAVPEPGMAGLGLAAIGLLRRRRR